MTRGRMRRGEDPPQSDAVVLRFTAGDLRAAHLELWDTGQPPHYDVVYVVADGLDSLVEALMATPNMTLINPHYDPDGGSER